MPDDTRRLSAEEHVRAAADAALREHERHLETLPLPDGRMAVLGTYAIRGVAINGVEHALPQPVPVQPYDVLAVVVAPDGRPTVVVLPETPSPPAWRQRLQDTWTRPVAYDTGELGVLLICAAALGMLMGGALVALGW